MLRPMFVEFPGDRACEMLDTQYMMGDDLLVAPVFKKSGQAEYYLPEGKWVNLLTGTVAEGGKWQKETHDYFSLPLLVRPGRILPLGISDTQVEYDYTEGLTLAVSWMEEDSEAGADLVDVKGRYRGHACARRLKDRITVEVSGDIGSWDARLLAQKGTARKENGKIVFTLE